MAPSTGKQLMVFVAVLLSSGCVVSHGAKHARRIVRTSHTQVREALMMQHAWQKNVSIHARGF